MTFSWISLTLLATSAIESASAGIVTLYPIDSFRRPPGGCVVERFVDSKQREYSSVFRGTVGEGIPFGVYRSTLRCRKGRPTTIIGVGSGQVWRVVDTGAGYPAKLDGTRKRAVVD